jgi:hypothetical protein
MATETKFNNLRLNDDFDNIDDILSSDDEDVTYPRWNKDQISIMKGYLEYHKSMIKLIEQACATGPVAADVYFSINEPSENLLFIVKKTKEIKQNTDAAAAPEQKNKVVRISNMTNQDFNDHLKKALKTNATLNEAAASNETMEEEMPVDNLEVMGNFLKIRHSRILSAEYEMLKCKLKFGKYILEAQNMFDIINKRDRLKLKWCEWIEESLGISYSYVRRIILVYCMVKHYPKLQDLSFTFTELFNLRKKIYSVFKDDDNIKKEWL